MGVIPELLLALCLFHQRRNCSSFLLFCFLSREGKQSASIWYVSIFLSGLNK